MSEGRSVTSNSRAEKSMRREGLDQHLGQLHGGCQEEKGQNTQGKSGLVSTLTLSTLEKHCDAEEGNRAQRRLPGLSLLTANLTGELEGQRQKGARATPHTLPSAPPW